METFQIKGIHCENCGSLDPETDDGYTTCCNEPECYGDVATTPYAIEMDESGDRVIAVRSCCWGAVRMPEDAFGGHADCSGCVIHTSRRSLR